MTVYKPSPNVIAADLGVNFIGTGSALTVLAMLVLHSDRLIASGVVLIAVGLGFLLRGVQTRS